MSSETLVAPAEPTPAVLAWRSFARWAGRNRMGDKLAVMLTILAIAAGFATYGALTDTPPFGTTRPRTVLWLLTLDMALLLALAALIARRIVRLWAIHRRGLAGSRLHVRLVAVFSLLAVTPAILVAAFSVFFFYSGIQTWFSERVRTAIGESLEVASAYLHEHQQNIRADALAMANDINQEAPRLVMDRERFNQVITTQAALRALSEAMVFEGNGRILARSGLTFTLEFEPVSERALQQARDGDVALMVSENDDRVRALVRLDRFIDTYLFVGRMVDAKVLAHMETVHAASSLFSELEGKASKLQITVTMLFILVSLLLLMAAVWTGINFATQLATPISALIDAAEHIRTGDLTHRVSEGEVDDDFGILRRTFNKMTAEIESQRRELVEANNQLDLRRRFSEAVLAGVSAGVIGLDHDGVINLPNQPAAKLLGVDDSAHLIGKTLDKVAPEISELLETLRRRPSRPVEAQVQVRRPGAPLRTLLVRIVAEVSETEIRGYVVTCDDITELLSAQRKAAWADVARRIAHEIKNPLTPIQLSAERLRRKYLREITSDKETFQLCTDTIVRHVVDIGRMVDEFSSFARMPTPVMKPHVLHDLCRQAVFLQSSAHPAIGFSCDLPPDRLTLPCDGRQISQALTNLLQNAVDALEGRAANPDGSPLAKGEIALKLIEGPEKITIVVEDNGKGLPPMEERHRLTEPYVTTRAKGTGLGLAIVKKIMEDHGGELVLADRAGGGASVSLVIPRVQDSVSSSEEPVTLTGSAPETPQRKQQAHGP